MIIFITSSFRILGAMKVNNLCLLKLPFKEQSFAGIFYQRHLRTSLGGGGHKWSSPGKLKKLIPPMESLSEF